MPHGDESNANSIYDDMGRFAEKRKRDQNQSELEKLRAENVSLRAQVERMKDGEEYTVDHYKAFWKAYDDTKEGEGKWNAWANGITAMMAVSFTSDDRKDAK